MMLIGPLISRTAYLICSSVNPDVVSQLWKFSGKSAWQKQNGSEQSSQAEENFSVAGVAIGSADHEWTKKRLCHQPDRQVVGQARLAGRTISLADFIGTEEVA